MSRVYYSSTGPCVVFSKNSCFGSISIFVASHGHDPYYDGLLFFVLATNEKGDAVSCWSLVLHAWFPLGLAVH